ncbi:hypothetical protein ACH5RR_028534 [Cinchona calisaya]|uniref:Uncharacterized protein n=1 Tax=Cinchona calisaya TaxID=153742 RepID=A0ABD2YUC5_9GENT
MMEDKQLNLNRPLLSVRRHTSTVASEKDTKKSTRSLLPSIPRPPSYKSELKSGPVTNPGSVPFVWEQSPGRPKDERILQPHSERPLVAPKLPPGRTVKANQQDNDNASENLTVNKSQVGNPHGSQSIPELDEYSRRFMCAEDTVEEAEEGKADSEDDDEVYEDALDTLSRTESFFFNCSVSGISGLDDSDVKSSGTLSTDPQAREFMIDRFLPAAKAMVSETPQYPPAPKKPVVQDNPRQLKKVVNGDKQPQLRYGPSFARHYSEFHDNGGEESDDDYDENGKFPTKACGFLPRFCLNSRLLNPLPGMSVRTRVPMSPATRVQPRSSSASTCSKTENEISSLDMNGQRSIDDLQTTELHEEKNDLNNKSSQISAKSQKLGPSTNRQGGVSSHYNEFSVSTEHKALPAIYAHRKDDRVDGFSSHEKNYRSFRDLLADDSTYQEVDSGSPAFEKTLYIDTVHKGKSPRKTCTLDKGLSNLRGKDDENSAKMVDDNLSKDSSLTEKLSIVSGGDILQKDFQKSLDFSLLSLADEPTQKIEKDAPKAFGKDQNHYQDAVDSKNLEVPAKQATQSLGKQTPKEEKVDNFHGISSKFPVPPPLPKSPSDSWLCRTLPSISSKNSSIHSHLGTGIYSWNKASKTQSGDPKWETIVKTTKMHHQHLRYSEELLPPIPES